MVVNVDTYMAINTHISDPRVPGKVLSGKQHPNLQDLGKLLLLERVRFDTGSRPSIVPG